MNTQVRAEVMAVRKHKSKAGNDGFKQDYQVLQDGILAVPHTHYFSDEKDAYPVGLCFATPSFYKKTFRLEDGKTVYETVTHFNKFVKADSSTAK